MATLKADAKDALTKWSSADYYGAGQAVGSLEKIVFAPWADGCNKATFLQ